MWVEFFVEWNGEKIRCEAKVFNNPSHHGLDDTDRGGRISKLYIYGNQPEDKDPWIFERQWRTSTGGGKPANLPQALLDQATDAALNAFDIQQTGGDS